jgi:Transposase DDE domain group 1
MKNAFELEEYGLSRVISVSEPEGTFRVNNSARTARVQVSADGRGLVSHAGAVLLWETMRVTGLARGLSDGLARWRAPRAVHDPGKIVADLAAAVALGGDCLADIAVLREQRGSRGRSRLTRWCPGWSARSRRTARGR